MLVRRNFMICEINVDLTPYEIAALHRKEKVQAALAYARKAARLYAKNLVRQQETIYGYNAIDGAGGEQGITKMMATYQVFEPLREYAARVCVRLVRERLTK
jgi:hypothetical protein